MPASRLFLTAFLSQRLCGGRAIDSVMAKLSDLKRGLKSANRRRQRRVVSPPQAQSSASSQVCAIEVAVGAILQLAEVDAEVDDRAVVAALRSVSRQSVPSRSVAKRVLAEIQAKADQCSVSGRQLREAVKQLLDLANSYDTLSTADPFLGYLHVISR